MKEYTKEISKIDYELIYKGDSINLITEHMDLFRNELPEFDILGIEDNLEDKGDFYLYTIKIEY